MKDWKKELAIEIFNENPELQANLLERAKSSESRYIVSVVRKDGVYDRMGYDKETGLFYIELRVGKGQGVSIEGLITEGTAFFGDTKFEKIYVD